MEWGRSELPNKHNGNHDELYDRQGILGVDAKLCINRPRTELGVGESVITLVGGCCHLWARLVQRRR